MYGNRRDGQLFLFAVWRCVADRHGSGRPDNHGLEFANDAAVYPVICLRGAGGLIDSSISVRSVSLCQRKHADAVPSREYWELVEYSLCTGRIVLAAAQHFDNGISVRSVLLLGGGNGR